MSRQPRDAAPARACARGHPPTRPPPGLAPDRGAGGARARGDAPRFRGHARRPLTDGGQRRVDAEHAVPPGPGRRRRRPAAPLALLAAVERGGRRRRGAGPARRPAAARRAAAGGAEDENIAEEALQGLLLCAPAGPALRGLQDQPPAQAAEDVAARLPCWAVHLGCLEVSPQTELL